MRKKKAWVLCQRGEYSFTTMIQLTLGAAKPVIAAACGNAGLQLTDALLVQRINSAVQELISEGDWPNVVDRYHVLSTDGVINLPSHLDRLMQINVAGIPKTVASPWWQFVAYGPGTREDQVDWARTWCDGFMIEDRGEYPSLVDIPATAGPWKLRVYSTVLETITAKATIQGLDENGLVVRTQVSGQWINGEQVALSDGTGSSMFETTKNFSRLDVFTKPETNGYIRLTAWNGTTEVELANYLPSDTDPSYHRYFSRWVADLQAASDSLLRFVRARCRKRFVPVSEDTDQLIITNVLALQEMVIAQWKRLSDDPNQYVLHKQAAVDIMRKEAMGYRGKSRVPSITFTRGYGIGSALPALR